MPPTKTVMKITIKEPAPNAVRVSMPDQTKAIALRPLWPSDTITSPNASRGGDFGRKKDTVYERKLQHIIDELNDTIEDFFMKSEKYNSASPDFKKDVKKALQQTRVDFINQLAEDV